MQVETTYTVYTTPPNCRDGPRFERGITDWICCTLYILFCLAVLILFFIFRGHTVGNYEKPFDYDHQPCTGEYPYIYIPTADTTKTVCVASCPSEPGKLMKCKTNSRFATCPYSVLGHLNDQGHHICYIKGMDTIDLIRPFTMKTTTDAVLVGTKEILISAGVAAGVALILVITTFIFPELMTYLYLVLFELLLAAISVGFFYRYFRGKLPFVDDSSVTAYQSNVVTLLIAIAFAAAFIVSVIVLLGKIGKISFVVTVLRIARRCLWENIYMIIVAFLLSGISIGVLALNLMFFYTAYSSGEINPNKHGPYDQFQYDGGKWWWALLVGLLYLWTHGLMIAISDFLYEGFASYWYFNERVFGYNYSRCSNFSNSVKLIFMHFGTACMGAILAYLPETLSTSFNHLEYDRPGCYNACCCCHKFCCRYLSKYCYIETILQSYAFWPANQQMFYLKRRVKQQVPQLYMMGNFYETAAKTFIVLLSMVVCYLFLITNQPEYYHNVFNLITPLVVTAFISSEIATHFMNCTGLIGDTLVIMYCVDLEIEKSGYGQTEAYSCPVELRPIIRQSKLAVV